ncbi:MAG TPA: carbohydrate ABC transporter permease [candidate division Zixibacteria bacterium]|nr:carbohydrate ABC transporter permease [candidate division Zixibacteria bacterium]
MKRTALLSLVFFAVAIYSVAPFFWFVLTSLKTPAELTAIPPTLLPSAHLGFYRAALLERGLLGAMANSAAVAGAATAITVAIGALAAYAVARTPMRAARFYRVLLLAVAMFPQIAVAGPLWSILDALGWLNTYRGLVATYTGLGLPLAVWILATFFGELPVEIEEAAMVDGCTRLQALGKVVLPLAAPGLATAALLVFMLFWNEFFFALIVMTDPALQTLPVAIALFPGEYTMPWGEIAAASTVATLPLIALTLAFQRGIIRGLSAGAVKG